MSLSPTVDQLNVACFPAIAVALAAMSVSFAVTEVIRLAMSTSLLVMFVVFAAMSVSFAVTELIRLAMSTSLLVMFVMFVPMSVALAAMFLAF